MDFVRQDSKTYRFEIKIKQGGPDLFIIWSKQACKADGVEFVADTLRLNLLELGKSGSHLIQVAGRLDYKCPMGETHDPITFTTRESHLVRLTNLK
ncbi:hypothetical protein ABEB36_009342 [Hypothenemus hampei]|uniref:Uncharacterized protein n=1 Tax=Hypothenemus hampei TaxID=57062 RepID=A0ABD1EI56_HYPHA